ncbi:tail fiber domain-containing protein [Yokenella regensburgei]|uniref:phage tailspike protein n=1 Tax=Yokenella regensburgei TaxID=158877 RepID=UPI003F159909
MPDLTANLVVGMPAQLFTLARSFKANANGKIFIGIPDTDPTNPANQIPVYVENEDGSLVQVPQPIVINAGGFPVLGGQIRKFVTVQNYSMLIQDAYGAQQFYFEDVAKYDPDQLEKRLAGPGGTAAIGHGSTTLFKSLPVNVKYHGAKGDGTTNDTAAFNAAELASGTNGIIYVPEGTYRITTPMALSQTARYYGPGTLLFDNAEWWRRGGSSGSMSVPERYTLLYDYPNQSAVSLTFDGVVQTYTWVDARTIQAAGTANTVQVKINITNGTLNLGPQPEMIRSYNAFGNSGGGCKVVPTLPDPLTSPSGYNNTSFGARALIDLTAGANNTAFGSRAQMSNKTGNNNTTIGFQAGYRASGDANTIVGSIAGEWIDTGYYNSLFGASAGGKLQDGNFNCSFGASAGAEAMSDQYCVSIGYRAHGNSGSASQSNSVHIGTFAGDANIGSNNTHIGYRAGNSIGALTTAGTGTGHDNVAVGMNCMSNNLAGKESVVIGAGAAYASTMVERSVFIGFESGTSAATLGSFSVAVGHSSLKSATGDNNVSIGVNSQSATTAGNSNVSVGNGSLITNTIGTLNTALGHNSGRLTQAGASTTNLTNTTTVGNDARVSGDNQVQLGNSATTTYVYGTVQNRSDARDKTEVRDTELGIDFILGLRPVDGKWDLRDNYITPVEETRIVQVPVDKEIDGELVTVMEDREEKFTSGSTSREPDGTHKGKRFHHWFIAQEVQKVCDSLGVEFGGLQHHAVNGGEDVYSLGYDEFIPPIVRALQQCWQRMEDLEKRISVIEGK